MGKPNININKSIISMVFPNHDPGLSSF